MIHTAVICETRRFSFCDFSAERKEVKRKNLHNFITGLIASNLSMQACVRYMGGIP